MMAHPETLRHCISWNAVERQRAERDAAVSNIAVPPSATKRVAGKLIPLTRDEYRLVRRRDAERYSRNIASLEEALA